MDDQIRRNQPEQTSTVSDQGMGPVRRKIMVVGFLMVFVLGLAMSIFMKNPCIQGLFCLGSVAYFTWLACWIGYK